MKVTYVPDEKGVRQIAQSAGMYDAVLDAAHRGASAAGVVDPQGLYVVEPVPVRSGYRNELRVGARITDVAPDAMRREQDTHALTVHAVQAIERG